MDIPISVRRFHDSEFKRHMVNSKSTLTKTIEDIKNKLRDHQLLKFKDSCFGHFLDINELMFSGQIVNHMLYKQCICDDKNVMEFNFGGSGARFTRQEFGLTSGLYCGEQPTTRPAPSTRISDTYFGGSKKTVVLSKAHKSTTESKHMEMVDDLKFFNSHPWDEQAFVSSIAWPVKESRYPDPPIVQDKTLSPNGHNNTCTTAIREKKRKKTKVAIEGSKKARRIGIPVFISPLSRKSPFVCRDRSSVDSSHRRKSHDIPKLSSIVQKLSHLEDEMTRLHGQVTQLDTKECAVYDKITGLETMLSKILGLLQEARPTVQVDDDSQRPHNSDSEQPNLDDVHGAYDDDGHKANFDDVTGYATNDVRIDESEDVEKQSNKDVRGDSTLVDKQLLFSPVLSPLPLQSTPLMVNSKADSEASVEVLTYVSPSKVVKGKQKRRAGHYITSPYNVASLRRSMRLTFPQGTQKFDPFSSHIEILTYLFRQRADKYPFIFDPRTLLLDCRLGQYMDMRWDSFKSNEMTYDFGDDMVEYLIGILLPLNKDNKHWLLGVINLKSRHVQLYDPKKWGYTADSHINYFEPRICQMLPYLLRRVQFFKVRMDISNSLKPFKISLADCSQQKINGDCGIFVLKYMEYLSAGRDMDFTSNDILFFRMKFTLKEMRAPDIATEISGSIVAPDVGPDICGSIDLKISLSQTPVYVTDVKPEDIGFDNSKDIVGGGS
ncbi:hypothetical protein FNV43_RR13484 [Rhamnella rubrinervis]|uniref:Ubiquitin-like protease family profile domain-containing protein n=1 Tax=Rhamnella rubrinervis TaxID=2594499 RepID=A0A8K0MEB1_9ROSA|nr:hypothetical protein FNV43_RR13484 [Rhamnella rubrinervis]